MSKTDILYKIIDYGIIYLYRRPVSIVRFLIKGSGIHNQESYFPEMKKKSKFAIWVDHLIECIKYGRPNEFYFPYGFDVKNRREMNEYLHYAPFMQLRDRQNIKPHSATPILRDKLYFAFFTQSLGINSGNNIAVIDDDKAFTCLGKKYINLRDFLSRLDGNLIFKPINGECGTGIFKLHVKDGEFYKGPDELSINDLMHSLSGNKYLVQEIVKQHPLMATLHPQSLNTIRLVTIRNIHTGEISVFPSILRIGTGESFVDNTSQGGLAVAVDLKSGRLGEYGFYKPEFGTKVSTHPDSGIKFSDFIIPFFKEAKEQALSLHKMLPTVDSIGWDIAIGENGPVFIEGNDNWEINGPQICNGPLKDKFYSLLK